MKKKQFAIIGLGYFGKTIALELTRLGNDVLVIDSQEKMINAIADQVTHAIIADASDEKVLKELNLQQYDAAVVAIGENIEASLLCTLHLKSLGVKDVWVKALNNQHHKLLLKLGANKIIHPEQEMGLRVAQSLNYPTVANYFELGDKYFVVDLLVQAHQIGKTIEAIIFQNKTAAMVLAVKRNNIILKNIDNQLCLNAEDQLIIVGTIIELHKFSVHP